MPAPNGCFRLLRGWYVLSHFTWSAGADKHGAGSGGCPERGVRLSLGNPQGWGPSLPAIALIAGAALCVQERFVTITSPDHAGINAGVGGVMVAESPTCPGLSAVMMVRLPPPESKTVHCSLSTARCVTLTGTASPESTLTSVAASPSGGTTTVKLVPTGTVMVGGRSTSLNVIEAAPEESVHDAPPWLGRVVGGDTEGTGAAAPMSREGDPDDGVASQIAAAVPRRSMLREAQRASLTGSTSSWKL